MILDYAITTREDDACVRFRAQQARPQAGRKPAVYGELTLVESRWRSSPYLGALEIATLTVESGYRRQGIATALCRSAFSWAHEHGGRTVMVTAYALNAPALAFYRSLGLRDHYITFDTYWRP